MQWGSEKPLWRSQRLLRSRLVNSSRAAVQPNNYLGRTLDLIAKWGLGNSNQETKKQNHKFFMIESQKKNNNKKTPNQPKKQNKTKLRRFSFHVLWHYTNRIYLGNQEEFPMQHITIMPINPMSQWREDGWLQDSFALSTIKHPNSLSWCTPAWGTNKFLSKLMTLLWINNLWQWASAHGFLDTWATCFWARVTCWKPQGKIALKT